MSKNRFNVAIFNDTNTRTTRHYGCSLVMYNLVSKLKEHHIDPVFFWPVGLDWRDYRDELKSQLISIDAIIVNGEGSIHHSSKSEKAVFLADIANFATGQLNVPAYLINSTLYENDPDLYKKLGTFRNIFVRESSSLSELSAHGLSGNIVPDLTLSGSTTQQQLRGEPRQIPGRVNSIPDIESGNPDRRSSGDILVTDSTFQELKETLEDFSRDMNGTFISMKEPDTESVNSRLFKKMSRFFGSIGLKPLKRLAYLPVQLEEALIARRKTRRQNISSFSRNSYTPVVDHDRFVNTIRLSRLVITGRFHTVTLCIKTGTPFLAIESNTPKISALLKDVFGTTDRLITMEELTERKRQLSEEALTFSNEELTSIEQYNRLAVEKIDDMFNTIVTDISRHQ